jgi:hypothetical protein
LVTSRNLRFLDFAHHGFKSKMDFRYGFLFLSANGEYEDFFSLAIGCKNNYTYGPTE